MIFDSDEIFHYNIRTIIKVGSVASHLRIENDHVHISAFTKVKIPFFGERGFETKSTWIQTQQDFILKSHQQIEDQGIIVDWKKEGAPESLFSYEALMHLLPRWKAERRFPLRLRVIGRARIIELQVADQGEALQLTDQKNPDRKIFVRFDSQNGISEIQLESGVWPKIQIVRI